MTLFATSELDDQDIDGGVALLDDVLSLDTSVGVDVLAAGENLDAKLHSKFVSDPNDIGLSLLNSIGADRQTLIRLACKRMFDISVSCFAIVLLMPLFLCVALGIKITSRGPVIFVQPREGLHGKLFLAYKFRTMRSDLGDPTGVAATIRNDPRVTPIGGFLRRTSVDELPQLMNVIRGEMSLVGPRPHVPNMLAAGRPYAELVPNYQLRHAVKPGITGWAQVNGFRGEVDTADKAKARVDYDLQYIAQFSLRRDLKIIVDTARKEFLTGTGG